MSDWLLIAVRLALYVDLGLLFGMPLFALYALRGTERGDVLSFRRLVSVLAAIGAGMSLLGFLSMAAAMTGTGFGGVDRDTLTMLVSETAVGWAFVTREAALVVALLLCLWPLRPPVLFLSCASACGAVAVATLAWSGHGAANQGAAGFVHLASDVVHLIASSAWLGALFMLVAMVTAHREAAAAEVRTSHRALAGFATAGSILVALIIVSGLVNGAFLIGIDNLCSLGTTLYGQLLIAKLVLFAAMLALAAANRFRLVPALAQAAAADEPHAAIAVLRRSIAIESACAVAVLALVAWLGTLEPVATAL